MSLALFFVQHVSNAEQKIKQVTSVGLSLFNYLTNRFAARVDFQDFSMFYTVLWL
jgi:hypothetical protein